MLHNSKQNINLAPLNFGPTTGEYYIPLKYFLYDITGSLIEVGNISNGRITIGVKPGLYILQIEDKDELFKFKIIKY